MSTGARNGVVSAGLGWLDGTAKSPEPKGVADVIEAYFGKGEEVPASGFYREAVAFDGRRARVEWNGRRDAAGTVRAEINQTALDGLGLSGSAALLDSLTAAGFRASRVDLWLDDPEQRITPEKVRAAVLGGQAVTHAMPGRFWTDDATGRKTYYIGQPSSDRRMRVYDKLDPDRTRTELQARRDVAAHIVQNLVASLEADRARLLAGHVVRFVDFREGKGRVNGRRAPRLDWWEAVVGDVEKAEAAPSRPRPTIEQLAAWFEKTLGKTLAELHREMGSDWLDGVLRRGHIRLEGFETSGEWAA